MTAKRLWHLILALGILAIANPIQAQSHVHEIFSIAYSPDGTMLAVSGSNGYFEIRNAQTQQVVVTPIIPPDQWVSSLSWSPDSKTITGIVRGNRIKVWNIADRSQVAGELLATLSGFEDYIVDVLWSPSGDSIVGVSANDSDYLNIKGWSTSNYQLQFQTHAGNYLGEISWSPDNTHVAIAAQGGLIITDPVDLMSGEIDQATILRYTPTLGIAWSRDSKYLAYILDNGTIVIYDAISATSITIPNAILAGGQALFAWSPDDSLLATFGTRVDDGTVKVWDPTTGDLLSSRKTNYVVSASALDWSPDGKYLAYTSDPSTLAITPPFTGGDLTARVNACVSNTQQEERLDQQIHRSDWDHFISTVNTINVGAVSESCKSQLLAMARLLKATQ